MVDIINEYSERVEEDEDDLIVDFTDCLDKLSKGMFCEHLGFFSETIEDKLNMKLLGWESEEESFK